MLEHPIRIYMYFSLDQPYMIALMARGYFIFTCQLLGNLVQCPHGCRYSKVAASLAGSSLLHIRVMTYCTSLGKASGGSCALKDPQWFMLALLQIGHGLWLHGRLSRPAHNCLQCIDVPITFLMHPVTTIWSLSCFSGRPVRA